MNDKAPDYKPIDLKENTDVSHPQADSIQFVTVPEKEEIFLYVWDTENDEPVSSAVGFDADGIEKLQNWITNVDIEARQAEYSNYGEEE